MEENKVGMEYTLNNPPNSITLTLNEFEFALNLTDDGDILVNGKVITNDMEIVNGLKDFLIKTNCI